MDVCRAQLIFCRFFMGFLPCKLLIYSKKPPGERFEGSLMREKRGLLISFGFYLQTCCSHCLPRSPGVQYRKHLPLH